MVECDCRERLVLTVSEAVCRCAAGHTALVRKQLASRRMSDGATRPWDDYREWWKKRYDL